MTAAPDIFAEFAYALLTVEPGEELVVGPLSAAPDVRETWSVWFVKDGEPIYLDTIRPDQMGSAAELNVHLQELAPVGGEELSDEGAGPEPPAGAFQ